jgi:CheY-like chemotaxis protein
MVGAQAERLGVALPSMQPPGSLPRVHADRTRLLQVLLNLLTNAVKYNRRGGRVAIACDLHQPTDADAVTISISDEGRGLTADEQARLFEPFERLGAEGSAIEGTGIGLALSRHLLQAMGGTIGVDSTPGVGSRFWVRLPLAGTFTPDSEVQVQPAGDAGGAADAADAACANAADAAAAPGCEPVSVPAEPPMASSTDDATGPPATVLYIEDNPVNAMVMQAMVERLPGVRLVTCEDGEAGLRLASQQQPALILTDIQMPGMDGFEVLKRLRADPALRAIPVVAISADAMPQTLARGQEAGFDAYLTKPVAMEALQERITRLLRPAA